MASEQRAEVARLIAEYEARAANESARFVRATDVVDDLRGLVGSDG